MIVAGSWVGGCLFGGHVVDSSKNEAFVLFLIGFNQYCVLPIIFNSDLGQFL
jgi:hypothetical protein